MSTTGTGEPTAEALVEQPREGVADFVQQTEEERLQEVERERMEREKREEASKRVNEELEKAQEETRKMRDARSEENKILLEVARANEARRRANVSAREQANSTL
jgi:hypothetical protein